MYVGKGKFSNNLSWLWVYWNVREISSFCLVRMYWLPLILLENKFHIYGYGQKLKQEAKFPNYQKKSRIKKLNQFNRAGKEIWWTNTQESNK